MGKRLNELKIGEKVSFGRFYGKPITWVIADQNHKGYPDAAVTVVAADILKLAAFDAKEPGNEERDRSDYGNNNYRESNIRAWLNSEEGPGKWFEKTHRKDAPPIESNVSCNPYADHPGFLAEFSMEERAAILATELFTVISENDCGGRGRVEDKVFLLSAVEVGFPGDDTEGCPLSLFTDDASRIARLSPEAAENSAFKHNLIRPGETWYWWLRTPYAAFSSLVRGVSTGGTLNGSYAYGGYRGLRPACNLKSDLLISDSPDTEGAYRILLEHEFFFAEKESLVITIESDDFKATGIERIAAERDRQIKVERWDEQHDDSFTGEQLALAAATYALPEWLREREVGGINYRKTVGDELWPWDGRFWKPSPENRIRELEKAGALIAAEIDRLLRVEDKKNGN